MDAPKNLSNKAHSQRMNGTFASRFSRVTLLRQKKPARARSGTRTVHQPTIKLIAD